MSYFKINKLQSSNVEILDYATRTLQNCLVKNLSKGETTWTGRIERRGGGDVVVRVFR